MYGYNIPPPPPPPPLAPAPYMGDMVYEIAVEPNAAESPPRKGGGPLVTYGGRGRDERRKEYYGENLGIGRSGSQRERRGASVHVGDSRRARSRSRARSYYRSGSRYDDYDHGVSYGGGGGGGHYYPDSMYSSSSRGSPRRDRSRPRNNRYPSPHSDVGFDYPYMWPPNPHVQQPPPPPPPPGAPGGVIMAPGPPPVMPPGHPMAPGQMVPWQRPQAQPPPDLNERIAKLQLELEQSKKESDMIKKRKEEEEAKKKKDEELQKAVAEKLERDRKAAEAKKKAEEAEAARIKAAAEKLIEDEKKAAEAAKKKAEEEKKRIELAAAQLIEQREKEAQKKQAAAKEAAAKEAAAVQAVVSAQQAAAQAMKPTHTKFSKTHLCKEALDERKMSYTENDDHFLVHRWVDRDEQNALWTRTKQIRAYQLEYQKRFKEEADKAPVIDTPNGPVKIVRVGNNPPVTVPVVIVTKKAPVSEEVGKFRLFR